MASGLTFFATSAPSAGFFDIMEPFSPEDPLTKLLAQARKIEARSNFTQNVVRAARQTPQDRGWLAGVRAWWMEGVNPGSKWAFAAGVTAAVTLTVAVLQMQPQTDSSSLVNHSPAVKPTKIPALKTATVPAVSDSVMPDLPAAETAWEAAYQTEALLAVEDTTKFTDSEIGFLLY
jgi:hypothetical protein